MEERYYLKYAAAAVRGRLLSLGESSLLGSALAESELDLLSNDDFRKILEVGASRGIKLYHFKKSDRRLPRVSKVLGFLRGIDFENLLDVGSGRGVFLLPFLEEFPNIPVHSLEILDKRVEFLSDINKGGVGRLKVSARDICDKPLPDKSFDVVTMLEVLEHIPHTEAAIRAAVAIARKFVVITVPSKEDSNPEHIHLLTKEKLTALFYACGVTRLSFDAVPGHLFMVANMQKEK